MAEKKSSAPLILLIAGAFVVLAGAYYFATTKDADAPTPVSIEGETPEQAEGTIEPDPSELTEDAAATPTEAGEKITEIDTAKALGLRILGDPNAPVKVAEFASLTCGHCAHFHEKTFKPFKEAWIDTGKAYLVFSDFPLNAPALQATMIARCLPQENYFPFIQMLFETQKEWAYDVGYINYLKAKAMENGLSEEGVANCLQNEELQNGILDRVRAAQEQWEVSSTPSFVINNQTLISGALPYDEFQAKIEAAINPLDVKEEESAPAAEEAPAEAAPAEEPQEGATE